MDKRDRMRSSVANDGSGGLGFFRVLEAKLQRVDRFFIRHQIDYREAIVLIVVVALLIGWIIASILIRRFF